MKKDLNDNCKFTIKNDAWKTVLSKLETNQMDHKEKVDKMIQEFTKQGIKKSDLAPPIHRLLWKCGIKIAPPLFASFLTLFVSFALLMSMPTVSLCLLSYLLSFGLNYKSIIILISMSVFGGLGAAIDYRIQAKRMHLPFWKDYLKNESEVEAKGKVRKKGSGLREKKRFVLK